MSWPTFRLRAQTPQCAVVIWSALWHRVIKNRPKPHIRHFIEITLARYCSVNYGDTRDSRRANRGRRGTIVSWYYVSFYSSVSPSPVLSTVFLAIASPVYMTSFSPQITDTSCSDPFGPIYTNGFQTISPFQHFRFNEYDALFKTRCRSRDVHRICVNIRL